MLFCIDDGRGFKFIYVGFCWDNRHLMFPSAKHVAGEILWISIKLDS